VTLLAVAAIGLGVGFLSGLLGKGGSAIASPLLHLAGVPALVALAAPLPATIPSTMAAGSAYARRGFVDWRTVRWTVAVGVPATIAGAIATRWIDGSSLIAATDVVLIALGVRLVLRRHVPEVAAADTLTTTTSRIVLVALVVGLASGLLANSGGFLLAPLYLAVLHRPIKAALATSLAAASMLAIPGAVVHTALGHVDWRIVGVLAVTSVPLSFLGARVGLRTDAQRLERGYGVALATLGTVFLVLL
jgi:uncharacterized membrane protein YfcA